MPASCKILFANRRILLTSLVSRSINVSFHIVKNTIGLHVVLFAVVV